jgi:uncharacterized protein (DUF488 family)
MIFSIGHGNKDINRFISELHSFDIQFLIDIRSKPYSKFCPHFSQQTLKTFVENENIRYVYMGKELGGLPMHDASCFTDTGKIDYNKLKDKDFFKSGLQRLLKANAQNIKVCIMCSESDPKMCHRSKLIGSELQKMGVELQHIIDVSKALTQNQLTRGQELFSEKNFTSRKSYR